LISVPDLLFAGNQGFPDEKYTIFSSPFFVQKQQVAAYPLSATPPGRLSICLTIIYNSHNPSADSYTDSSERT